jgi:hypothetical protein
VLRLRIVSVAAIVLLAEGCVVEAPLAPGASRVTLDQALAELAIPALAPAGATFTRAGLIPAALTGSRCGYEPQSGSFACPPITANGVTLTESFTLLDTRGARRSAFDGSTSTLRLARSVTGKVTEPTGTPTIDGDQVLVLTDLQGDRHTLNGSSTTYSIRTPADQSGPPVTTTHTITITNLVIPVVPTGAPPAWPYSGKIEILSSTDADYPPPLPGPGPMIEKITITFSGTSIVSLTMISRGALWMCKADMTVGLGCSK